MIATTVAAARNPITNHVDGGIAFGNSAVYAIGGLSGPTGTGTISRA